jgi:hypothetical protein
MGKTRKRCPIPTISRGNTLVQIIPVEKEERCPLIMKIYFKKKYYILPVYTCIRL